MSKADIAIALFFIVLFCTLGFLWGRVTHTPTPRGDQTEVWVIDYGGNVGFPNCAPNAHLCITDAQGKKCMELKCILRRLLGRIRLDANH